MGTIRVVPLAGGVQWCPTQFCAGIGIGPVLEQQLGHVHEVVVGCPMQGGIPVVILGVHGVRIQAQDLAHLVDPVLIDRPQDHAFNAG